ncbi:DcaP family trimeric outer membrane transporter [Marinobacter fonticola]|uniref:DcaP family trimeric outer membrane transporter n=1 Tax=Marinobacter fonticola TaxID=2603215 RepID=UPI001D0DB9EA|nr:DcaP family trimeric outer membrane transporter [Marinobacter fonticola]
MTTRNGSFRAHPLTRAVALAGLPLIAAMSMPANAQDDAEVEELRQRVEQLEQKLGAAVSTAPEATQDNPYILREGDGLKIGDTTISFGGFIKADLIYGSNGNGTTNAYSVGLARNFASFATTDNDWKAGFSARESRFSFGTETEDVGGHALRTYLEMDFNTGADAPGNEVVSNSYNPRLRQAYGAWNGWEFGQTYTTFSDLAALPEILNQGKMAAFIYTTQPMIRYNMAAPGGKIMVSLEEPEDGFGSTSYDDQSYPDLAARYQVRGNYGFYSIAGLVRSLEDDASDDSKVTGAVSLSARIPTFGRDDLRMQYSYGSLGRYMGLFTYPDVDLVEQAQGEVDPLKTYGATIAYRHYWSPTWRSSLVGSHTEIVDDLTVRQPAQPNGTLSYFDSSTSVHANLMWTPHANLTLGVEYSYWDFGVIASESSEQYEQVMASAIMQF